MQAYKQFQGMEIPEGIEELPKLTREQIVNKMERKIDISKKLFLSVNTQHQRPAEISIHTADIGANYKPDFDFSDLYEYDAWRKTCKLKFNMRQFHDVDFVRCEGFLHKAQICESLTLLEEFNRMLKVQGEIQIVVLDLVKLIKKIAKCDLTYSTLQKFEKQLFSAGDSTGIYFNRTLWTFQRLEGYLKLANFAEITNVSKEEDENMTVKAKKINDIIPDNNTVCEG